MVPWDPSPLPVMSLPAWLAASRGVRMLPQPWRLFSRAADDAALRRIRKVLCVAEKNDAARGIADLLSNSRMRRVGTRCISLPLVHMPMGLAELAKVSMYLMQSLERVSVPFCPREGTKPLYFVDKHCLPKWIRESWTHFPSDPEALLGFSSPAALSLQTAFSRQ